MAELPAAGTLGTLTARQRTALVDHTTYDYSRPLASPSYTRGRGKSTGKSPPPPAVPEGLTEALASVNGVLREQRRERRIREAVGWRDLRRHPAVQYT